MRERLCCCDGSARELHWHYDHSEREEPNDSELTQQASLISWQGRSIGSSMPQAGAPNPRGKSATTSLDQSCPMTSVARHSLLCPYSSSSPEVTLAEDGLLQIGPFWPPIRPHVCQVRRLAAASKCKKDQCTRLKRFRGHVRIWQHLI